MIVKRGGLMEGQNMSATTEKWTIFGERLKTELERQGMSLRQFSGKTGITLNTAFRYVHSQRIPRATEILKAAKVLGVTCDYMLGLSDDPHKTRDGWTKARNLQPTCNLASDCISRQAVIRINQSYHGQMPNEVNHRIWKEINELPSAQPEKRTEKHTETHACDCIERQAAINEIKEIYEWHDNVTKERIIEHFKRLPSAQPEIVRCEDCKHWSRESICDGFCSNDCMRHDEDFYCGYAERRTDDKTNKGSSN